MSGRLFMLLALVVVIAAAWAALVTLFSPPLTLGWREFSEAMVSGGSGTSLSSGLAPSSCSCCGFSSSRFVAASPAVAARRADSGGARSNGTADPVDTVSTPGQDSRAAHDRDRTPRLQRGRSGGRDRGARCLGPRRADHHRHRGVALVIYRPRGWRRIAAHRTCMIAAFAASSLFLITYLIHHAQVGSVPSTVRRGCAPSTSGFSSHRSCWRRWWCRWR